MDKPKISVIIPIHNAEPFLGKCIDSIVDQSFREIEILCIDDCSTDGSRSIVDTFVSKDERVKSFALESNMGAPFARNLGLREAVGDYVSFVDADDRLLPEAYNKLYHAALRNRSDAVKGNMLVHAKFRLMKRHPLCHRISHDVTDLSSCGEIHHLRQYQAYLFRLNVIRQNDVSFDEDLKNCQDILFMARLLPFCRRISLIDDPVYIHTLRKESISSSRWNMDNYRSLISGIRRSCSILNSHGLHNISDVVAKMPSDMWYKFEKMPILLSQRECFDVFSMIAEFYKEYGMPLWWKTSGDRIKLFFCMLLLNYYHDALGVLKKNNKFILYNKFMKLINR